MKEASIEQAAPLEMPAEFSEQERWAKDGSVGEMDQFYFKLRHLAARRILIEGICQAFDLLPDLDRVVLHFNHSKASLKDSMRPEAAEGTEQKTRDNLAKKFDKHMSSVRSRVGASREIWENLARFFGHNQDIVVARQTRQLMKERMFNQHLQNWTDEMQAEVLAEHIEQASAQASGNRKGPRL